MATPEDLPLAYLEAHPTDAAKVLERQIPADVAILLAELPTEVAAPVLRQMLPLHGADCLERLEEVKVAELLRGVGPQAGVALLRHLGVGRRAALLARLPAPMAVAFRLLLGYSPDTVGGWMDPRVLVLPADMPAGDALERVRQSDHDRVAAAYVVDGGQRLQGFVEVVDLLRGQRSTPVAHIQRRSLHRLPAQSLLTSVRDHPGWGEHRVLPVVERDERFVGALNRASLMQALRSRAEAGQPAAEGALVGLAGVYWSGVSGLIETLVGGLPVRQARDRRP